MKAKYYVFYKNDGYSLLSSVFVGEGFAIHKDGLKKYKNTFLPRCTLELNGQKGESLENVCKIVEAVLESLEESSTIVSFVRKL